MKSADGRGRTVFEMLTGKNKRDMTPQETQVHNPLEAKIGCSVTFEHEPELRGYNFFIESIWVWETKIGRQKFYHTDYNLRATVIGKDKPIRIKLRLIPDEDTTEDIGHKIQVLEQYMEFGWKFCEDNNFLSVLEDPEGVFRILQDREGNPYDDDNAPTFWRVDDVREPYTSRVTILKDVDGDGVVQSDELEHLDYQIWDYSRETTDENGQSFVEFLNVEQDVDSRYFTIYRGREVKPFQITVI
jgi:hypothetical protein